MVRLLLAGVCVLAGLTACGDFGRDDEIVVLPADMVAGQRRTVLARDACLSGGSKSTRPCVTNGLQRLVSAEIGPPFTIEHIEHQHAAFAIRLHAEREGEALLKVTVINEDGEEKSASGLISAHDVDSVHLRLTACNQAEMSAPLLVPADTVVGASWELIGDGRRLLADDYFPYEATGVTFKEPTESWAPFQTPAALTTATITSPADPDFRVELETYDVSSIQTLKLEPHPANTELRVGGAISYLLEAELPRKPCMPAAYRVHAISETPSICGFQFGATTRDESVGSHLSVYGVAPGTCRVSASLEGGRLPVTLEIPVSP